VGRLSYENEDREIIPSFEKQGETIHMFQGKRTPTLEKMEGI